MADMERSRSTLAARMQLARRVSDAILPQDDDVTIVATDPSAVLVSADTVDALRSDFIITVLDLRIRVVLLPGTGPAGLNTRVVSEGVARLLWNHPETVAVLLVCDDENLSSRVVEAISSPAAQDTELSGTLRGVLANYVATLKPAWPPPPEIDTTTALSLDEVVRVVTAENLAARRAINTTIEQRRTARASLDDADQQWLEDAVRQVLLGPDGRIDHVYSTALRGFDD